MKRQDSDTDDDSVLSVVGCRLSSLREAKMS